MCCPDKHPRLKPVKRRRSAKATTLQASSSSGKKIRNQMCQRPVTRTNYPQGRGETSQEQSSQPELPISSEKFDVSCDKKRVDDLSYSATNSQFDNDHMGFVPGNDIKYAPLDFRRDWTNETEEVFEELAPFILRALGIK